MLDRSETAIPAWNVWSEPKASVLLVDDNGANLLALRAILDDLGCRLVDARSGEQALQILKTQDFAVVLLDVRMPGIGGFETAKLVRQSDRADPTPIIFLTAGDIDRAQIEEGYALGAVDLLQKPLSPIILQAKVRGFVELFQARQRAQREAEQLRLLVHGTADYAIFMLDPHGHVVTWNLGAERLNGYQADEIIGQHFSRFYPPDAIARDWPAHELKVAAAEGRYEEEGWRVRKDGSQLWANVVITALRDEQGQLRGYSKVTRDLTERKRGEENARRLLEEEVARKTAEQSAAEIRLQRDQLRNSEQRFARFMQHLPGLAWVKDVQGRYVYVNDAAAKAFRKTRAELLGKTDDEIFPPEIAALFKLNDHRALLSGSGIRVIEALDQDNGVRHSIVSKFPILNAEGQAALIGGMAIDISDLRRMEQSLRESEQRFRGLMEQAPFSVQLFDPTGKTISVNKAWEQLWGVTLSQIPDYNVLHDPQLDAKGITPLLQRAFAGEAVEIPAIDYDPNVTLPDRTIHNDSRRWVSAVAYPVEDESGRIQEVVLVHDDITARRHADEALRESERRLRLALEAGRMGVWDWNIRTNDLRWSDTLEPLHGLEPGTFDGKFESFQQLIHPDDRQMVAVAIEQALQARTGYEIEFRNIRPNGSVHWIAGKGMVFAGNDGQPERMIGVGMDITQRKRGEQTARFLADASAALAVLVDFDATLQKVASLAVPHFADWVAVDVVEGDGSLRRVAVAHVDPTKVALAHEMHHRYPPQRDAAQGAWNILRTGNSELIAEIPDELLRRSVQDEERLQIIRALGLRSYIGVPLTVRGKTLGVFTFIAAESAHAYDETDLHVAQDLAQRAAIAIENAQLYRELREADRRKDEFLATLAHELRNPLAPIRNSLQILKLPRVDAEVAEQTREMMERQVHHLVRLVDDLLDVSRVMRGKIELRKERIEMAAVIARAVETAQPLIDAQNHELHISVPAELLLLDVDPIRLTQVIGNLLTNAAKYTDAGGHIWLTATRDGESAVLQVRDSGIGIAPEMLSRVFELFVQVDHTSTKSHGGLGIGLTLVKNLVELHGGAVTARSAGLGQGCEFTVRLPIVAQPALPTPVAPRREPRQLAKSSGFRLLVVDDNEDAARSLALLLKLQGHEVRVAHDGAAALEAAAAYRPHLILLDLGMPGMDGYEVARQIRQYPGLEQVVLAALTGWGQPEDRRRTAEAGFNHHLVKPVEPKALDTLLAALQQG